MLSESTYKDCCQQLTNGDERVIATLYDHYGNALYGVIIRIVNNEEVAAELLQDTFIKIWKNGHKYDPKAGRLYTWMWRIARNSSINYIQSKYARESKNIQGDEFLVSISDDSSSSDQTELFDMKGAVEQLESKYSKVIEMIYFKGYTHKDVAEILALPLGTVKSRIKIALRELKKIYNYQIPLAVTMTILLNAGI